MRSVPWARIVLLAVLIGVLGVPPDVFVARAQQQQGPDKLPAQQTTPPTPPSGQQQQQKQSQTPPAPQSQISVESNLVNIDAVVTDQDGDILTNLKRENFRVLDDGHPQQITNFAPTDAPITIVILMEFSHLFYGLFSLYAKYWAYGFLNHLNQQDWVGFKIFDLKTRLVDDFTQHQQKVGQD